MRISPFAVLATLGLVSTSGGCSQTSPAPRRGNIVVAVTIDWEGAYLSADGLDALDAFRGALPTIPVTHFISAAYFTKAQPDAALATTLHDEVHAGDEVAVHIHLWESLARAAGVEPRTSPSFFTGTDQRVDLGDTDKGFDVDMDAYDAREQRALLRTSRDLLAKAGLSPSTAFRAGGFVASRRLLQALRDEGFTTDSSAIDARQVAGAAGEILGERVSELWPGIDARKQPWTIELAGGSLLEMPIAAFADYASTEEIGALLDGAAAQLARSPAQDVYVVLGFHQETAAEFVDRLDRALTDALARPAFASAVTFVTLSQAADRARARSH